MTRLAIIAALSLLFAWILCYGAMRTAERIAKGQQTRVESVMADE
jgi:hypothetical protein